MKKISLYIVLILAIACQNATKDSSGDSQNDSMANRADTTTTKISQHDTTVATLDVTKIIPGADQIRKANSYFVIVKGDTSTFRCHFSEWKADSTLFFVAKYSKDKSYKRQREELRIIMAKASSDFDLRALNTIGFGRLITTGDLAIRITQQYKAIAYKEELNAFLLHSVLADEMNALLNPYGIKVKQVITEKQEYLPHQQLSKYSIIETPEKGIPDEIVDCVVYLKLERI